MGKFELLAGIETADSSLSLYVGVTSFGSHTSSFYPFQTVLSNYTFNVYLCLFVCLVLLVPMVLLDCCAPM